MALSSRETCPLPENPVLAETARALNEAGLWAAARIEACAGGGRILASKDLVERLGATDAATLDLDPSRITYTPLGELATATEKARRDAPTIPVCELPALAA